MTNRSVLQYALFVLFAGVLLTTMVCAIQVAQRDWRYFTLEKQLGLWDTRTPPELETVHDIAQTLKGDTARDPRLLRLYAWVLEWKAFIDPINQRFYFYGAEESLQALLVLRPTDSQAWAHLALLKSKLSRDSADIDACLKKAKILGAGDEQTTYVIRKLTTS